MVTSALLFRPSITPLENCLRARSVRPLTYPRSVRHYSDAITDRVICYKWMYLRP